MSAFGGMAQWVPMSAFGGIGTMGSGNRMGFGTHQRLAAARNHAGNRIERIPHHHRKWRTYPLTPLRNGPSLSCGDSFQSVPTDSAV
jgi:hypothetical protein